MTDTPTCPYRHDTEPDVRPAAWVYIDESGDYYVCDEHFQRRTDEGKRNWHRIEAMTVTAPYTDEAIRRVVREWAKLDRQRRAHDVVSLIVDRHAPDLARALAQLLAEYRAGR